MQYSVHGRSPRPFFAGRKQRGKSLGVVAAAFEARAMTGGQRRHLVEKEHFRITVAEHSAVPVLEIEHTADPLPRRPTPRRQFSMRVVNAPTAVAHHEPARAIGEQIAKRIDAALQRHGRLKRNGRANPAILT
ncbi:MAG TPA: hypothetical protein VFW22_16935 [Pseudolabrys sp.]|nr:hypothetical protein [Pseudolabrys sp.]